MKRGVEPGGMNPNPTLFRFNTGSEDGEPQPEAIPASIQSMMTAMNMSGPVDARLSSARPQVHRHFPSATAGLGEIPVPRIMATAVRQ